MAPDRIAAVQSVISDPDFVHRDGEPVVKQIRSAMCPTLNMLSMQSLSCVTI